MPLSGSRILYVDDDEGLCHLAKRHLERLGCTLTFAHSGCAGIELARAQPFDLVALDHIMPGMGGLEALGHLMALPSPPAVIYVTGSDETGVAVAALKAGAVDYVVKTGSGDFFELLTSTLHQALGTLRLRKQKEQFEMQLRETNAQLEALLHEMNHRVANSLQMVSSLVSLQTRRATGQEARAMLQDVRHRIQAISRIHRQLYTGESFQAVNMREYLEGMARDLTGTFSSENVARSIKVVAQDATLPAATAVTLGVLVNELVSNACKYAYGKEESGEVRIRFELEGTDGYHLRVEDDGVGMQDDAKPQGTGLGSQIITAMTRSLGAKHSFSTTGKGLQVNIYRAPTSDQPIDLSGAPVTLPLVSAAPTGLGMNT